MPSVPKLFPCFRFSSKNFTRIYHLHIHSAWCISFINTKSGEDCLLIVQVLCILPVTVSPILSYLLTYLFRGLSPQANYSDRRLSAKLVPTSADRGCHVVSLIHSRSLSRDIVWAHVAGGEDGLLIRKVVANELNKQLEMSGRRDHPSLGLTEEQTSRHHEDVGSTLRNVTEGIGLRLITWLGTTHRKIYFAIEVVFDTGNKTVPQRKMKRRC
jgi:hypothetical protein